MSTCLLTFIPMSLDEELASVRRLHELEQKVKARCEAEAKPEEEAQETALSVEAARQSLVAALTELGVNADSKQNDDKSVEQTTWVKNLFLKDRRTKKLFMLTVRGNTKVNLKELSKTLKVKEVRFASPADLQEKLIVEKGCVTALSVFHDMKNQVTSLLERSLLEDRELRMCSGCQDAHDHDNHKIASLTPAQLQKFLADCNHVPTLLDL